MGWYLSSAQKLPVPTFTLVNGKSSLFLLVAKSTRWQHTHTHKAQRGDLQHPEQVIYYSILHNKQSTQVEVVEFSQDDLIHRVKSLQKCTLFKQKKETKFTRSITFPKTAKVGVDIEFKVM